MSSVLQIVEVTFTLSTICQGLSVDNFIPFGHSEGDTLFFSNDDNTTSTTTPLKFPFYNRWYNTIHINNNGLLSFVATVPDYTPKDFPVKAPQEKGIRAAFVAPFWADVDTRAKSENNGSGVYFRTTEDQEILKTVTTITDKFNPPRGSCVLVNRFTPKWALIATWVDVSYYELHTDKLNTFQVVVTTDGLFSFAIFNYAKIEWVTGDASQGNDGFGGIAAMVGANAGDGIGYIKYEHSLTDDVVKVVNATNVGVPGQLVYRIDNDVLSSTGFTNFFGADKCDSGDLCVSPGVGTIHSGGVLTVVGPPTHLLFQHNNNIKMKFEGEDEQLETKCSFISGDSNTYCPVPLFSPNGTGVKNITLLLDGCTTGYSGQYRVEKPTIFIDGSLEVLVSNNANQYSPLTTVTITSTDVIYIKWNPISDFATDRIPSLNDVEIGLFVHFAGPGISYIEEGPHTSGWRTVDIVNNFLSADLYTVADAEARIYPHLTPTDSNAFTTPPPSLIFFRVTAVVNSIVVFASTPLLSYMPGPVVLNRVQTPTCYNYSESDLAVVPPPPKCPQSVSQAFLDNNFEVDPGCVEASRAPLNCYINPGANVCFRVLQTDTSRVSPLGQCCYNANGALLIRIPGMGLPFHSLVGDSYVDHFRKNIWPFLVCCKSPKSPDEVCKQFLSRKIPRLSSRLYEPPAIGCLFESCGKLFPDTPEVFLTFWDNRFTAPLMLTSNSSENLNCTAYLCYQLHYIPIDTVLNLFSSPQMSINTRYTFLNGQYFMSSIGIVLGGAHSQTECNFIAVIAYNNQCLISLNKRNTSTSTNTLYVLGPQYNIQVHSTHETVTLVATSTKPSSRIIAKITCENHPGRHYKILKLAIPTSLTFTNKKSHGLLGQFWNVKATVRSPECEDFSLFPNLPFYKVILPPNGTQSSPRIIPAIHHFRQWDNSDSSCLHTRYEEGSAVAGTEADYIMHDLLSTRYKYSKFSMKCVQGE